MRVRTWVVEIAVVTTVLLVVWVATGARARELVGVLAVAASFAHGQVAERMREQEAVRTVASVHCHRMSVRYFVAKEAAWCVYFLLSGAWSALVGVALFLLYPVWRTWWRSRHPVQPVAPVSIQSGVPVEPRA